MEDSEKKDVLLHLIINNGDFLIARIDFAIDYLEENYEGAYIDAAILKLHEFKKIYELAFPEGMEDDEEEGTEDP